MEDKNLRPIVLVSNSSWYLYHYRKLLMKNLKKNNLHIIAVSPYDTSSKTLSKYVIHIPWKLSRKKDKNLYSLFMSFIRMIFLIRVIKPKLIHSHTLQANLITSIVSSIFGIKCILSFAGIGRFDKSRGLSRTILICIFKFIYFFSNFERESKFRFISNPKRTVFIFQNQKDIDFIKKEILKSSNFCFKLIPGSGVPSTYISKSKKYEKKNYWLKDYKLFFGGERINSEITFIYCARLLKSKGILTFLEIAKLNPKSKFIVYGSIDTSSKDSLRKDQIIKYKEEIKNTTFFDNKFDPLLYINLKFPILIVPSIYGEGFPRAIIEATTLKIPVISSKEAANKIPQNNLSFVSKNNNPHSYVKCIDNIIKEYYSDNLKKILIKAKQKTIDNYSEDIIVQKTLKIYNKLNSDNNSYLLNKDKENLNQWFQH